ncbi:sce7725 family protein [Nesterenkonia rhizosphaerae]|uniref:Sce7725 family protein n=1 Tax=Nesterenkonia rhizosphaerae TaxID=1348272 RepID=A0ABP9FV97_9MICC
MYHPFFRGKQYELLAIRESAEVISEAGFVPIIEPVRETFTGLKRALDELDTYGAQAAVIVNPHHGDHKYDGQGLVSYIDELHQIGRRIVPAILLTSSMATEEALNRIAYYRDRPLMLVHAGFQDGAGLAAGLDRTELTHVFLDTRNSLYRRHFRGGTRVLVLDGFQRKKNSDYARTEVELFSELHITHVDQSADGYGDFLTIGDYYAEGGGPAYAVAIHLTFIDPHKDEAMYVHHFVSDSNDTPVDPAGKFQEALSKLVAVANNDDSHFAQTSALAEFRELHSRGHYPGLGYVKKLSIKHHLETLAEFHANE